MNQIWMFDSQEDHWKDTARGSLMEEIEMKTMMRLTIMLALTVLLTGMAHAGTDMILEKVKTTSVNSATTVRGLETYYGEAFPTSAIDGYRAGDSLGTIMKADEITLRNGRSYRTHDIEYAFIAAKRPNVVVNGGSKAPHEKAPHEKAPHEQN